MVNSFKAAGVVQVLLAEIQGQSFCIPTVQIERILPVSRETAEAFRAEQSPLYVISDGQAWNLECLRFQLFGTRSSLLRGTRILLPVHDNTPAYICELVVGIFTTSSTSPDVTIRDGKRIQKLDLTRISLLEGAKCSD